MKKTLHLCMLIVSILLVSTPFLNGQQDSDLYTKVKWGMDSDSVKKAIGLEFKSFREKGISAETEYLGLQTTVIYVFENDRLAAIVLKISLGDEKNAKILADHYNKISADLSKTYGEYKNYDAFKKGEQLTAENDTDRAFYVLMSKLRWKRDWIADGTTVIATMEAQQEFVPGVTVFIFEKK